jgi:branched-chain amino acid aminotransferase
MLDKDGYVAETNATNLFLVKQNILFTPTADVCLPGVTRQTVIDIARGLNIPVVEKRLSLVDFYAADEVFTTATMAELTKVNAIGKKIQKIMLSYCLSVV